MATRVSPEGWASDTDPYFTDEQLARREAQRAALCEGVPVWRLAGTDQCVYSTWWAGTPVVDGVPYSEFVGRFTVARALDMGAREY